MARLLRNDAGFRSVDTAENGRDSCGCRVRMLMCVECVSERFEDDSPVRLRPDSVRQIHAETRS